MVAKKRIKLKRKPISQAIQFKFANEKFENSKVKYINGKWQLMICLQPTPFSPMYPIEITKNAQGNFEVWLVGNIKKIDHPDFPHNYKIDKKEQRVKLCLYHPKKFEWDKFQFIHNTIIPWACEWLYYYELWLDDDIWRGGGEHPS